MKQFRRHIITIILLLGCVTFFQGTTYATEVEIHGQIGRNEAILQPQNESESDTNSKLAQPKQTHIGLKRFPNNGSVTEKLMPIGLLLLLIYLVLNRWKAHRNKRLG